MKLHDLLELDREVTVNVNLTDLRDLFAEIAGN